MSENDARFDLVILADRVVTMDAAVPEAQAVAVRGGMIVAVGNRASGVEWAAGAADVRDFGRATVTPGLIDVHSHPVIGMRTARGIDLGDVETVSQLDSVLREHATANPDGWILAWNLGPRVYADAHLGVEHFRRLLPGRSIFVKTFDYHGAFVSEEVLEAAGIRGPVEFSSNAHIECDADGTPTGGVWEMEAVALVERAIPQPPLPEQAEELLRLLDRMAASGLTLTHSLILDPDEIPLLKAAEASRPLPLRYRVSPVCEPGMDRSDLERLAALQGQSGQRWAVEGIKFFLDGTVDNGTAWLRSPDSHGQSTQSIWQKPEDYATAMRFFAERGILTATHAIGDAAIAFALRTIGQLDAPARGSHRIEHIETLPPELVGEFADILVTASMQPAHCCMSLRADQTDNWSQRLGHARADRAFALRDILDAGGRVAISSDWPIGPFDPREIMAIAETRRRVGRPEMAPVLPLQGLSRNEALEAYTLTAAATAGRNEGRIAAGMSATMTVYAGDFLSAHPDTLPAHDVYVTFIEGQIAYASTPVPAV